MEPTLIYDAASMSQLPLQTACIAAVLATVAALMWLLRRGGGWRTWVTGAAVVMGLVALAAQFELQQIRTATDVQVVEGPLAAPSQWRTRRAGKSNDYARWEGFWIGSVGFSYETSAGSNYFSNGGPHRLDLREGLVLKVHYIEKRSADVLERHIVRVELPPQ